MKHISKKGGTYFFEEGVELLLEVIVLFLTVINYVFFLFYRAIELLELLLFQGLDQAVSLGDCVGA